MLLRDHNWKAQYSSDSGALIREFYLPALNCAVTYDRATGYFSSKILLQVSQGLEVFAQNKGKMRLLVGCTLDEQEIDAIKKGEEMYGKISEKITDQPLPLSNQKERDSFELLSWMIAQGLIEVKLAIPCDHNKEPVATQEIFHAKGGVFIDEEGGKIAFNGSINESLAGWTKNWESFHVFTSWETPKHVQPEEEKFELLWKDEADRCRVLSVDEAIEKRLMEFLPPNDDIPRLMKIIDDNGDDEDEINVPSPDETFKKPEEEDLPQEPEKIETSEFDWKYFWESSRIKGSGDRVGEATSAVTPWPHQIRAFQRMYENWPPKLLIADEVGLGKTIEAGMLLRQAWISGKAKRIRILAPKAVLEQWQIELREKFNLNWPIYNGKELVWYDSPSMSDKTKKQVTVEEWMNEQCVIVSSHLMRRRERTSQLLESEPYDLVILDEAHHARRRGAGTNNEGGSNRLLSLMHRLKERTKGLILLTATPMQVHPVEVWDLLHLLGLPSRWSSTAFEEFFDKVSSSNVSHDDFEYLTELFKSMESSFGQISEEEAKGISGLSKLATRKLLSVLRDDASTPKRMLDPSKRDAAFKILRVKTPVSALISRHTRELLRRYFQAGKISTPIATRLVQDAFVQMTSAERRLYEQVEDYISSKYDNSSEADRNAIGFVMTIYRRRIASSFASLEQTLKNRLEGLRGNLTVQEDDIFDDSGFDENEVLDEEEAEALEREALQQEEENELEFLLNEVKKLPTDSKARNLLQHLNDLNKDGYKQCIVFTQFTDTLDFLRKYLSDQSDLKLLCYSGRGGEIKSTSGSWSKISREETKRRFRNGDADLLLCTDAAAEGLNFQFCGALINYDMPWNPMKVEQRIGRIDRLGQKYERIRIINLHYEDTVETDVYTALQERIGLFSQFVGKLQPILSQLPKKLGDITYVSRDQQRNERERLLEELQDQADELEKGGFDLDQITESDLEEPERPNPPYSWNELMHSLDQNELPNGYVVSKINAKEFKLSKTGMPDLRVTVDPELYSEHPGSFELWSPGMPIFPS